MKRLTPNVRVDSSNSVVVYKQSTQSVKVRQVFKLYNLIVRQINGVKLVLEKQKSSFVHKTRKSKELLEREKTYLSSSQVLHYSDLVT